MRNSLGLYIGMNGRKGVTSSTLLTGLAYLYEMNETSGTTMYDSSANSVDGTISGCTVNQTGLFNNSYLFTAASANYCTTTDTSVLTPTGSATWSTTFKLNSDTGSAQKLISKYQEYEIYNTSGTLYVRFYDSGGTTYMGVYKSALFSLNTWYNLVVVYNSSGLRNDIKIYLNGAEVTSLTAQSLSSITGISSGAQNLFFGGFYGGSQNLDGYMQQTAMWNKILTADEIAELYNSGAGKAFSTW